MALTLTLQLRTGKMTPSLALVMLTILFTVAALIIAVARSLARPKHTIVACHGAWVWCVEGAGAFLAWQDG